MTGAPVGLSVPALAGTRAESLRVCRRDGVELLFHLRDARGRAKRSGRLAADDQLIVPVECAAHGSASLFAFADNHRAWANTAAFPWPRGSGCSRPASRCGFPATASRPTASRKRARARARAKVLVTIPNAGGTRSTEILPDPDPIPVLRKAVNAALVELSR
jgi:hypothetical protein